MRRQVEQWRRARDLQASEEWDEVQRLTLLQHEHEEMLQFKADFQAALAFIDKLEEVDVS